MVRPGGNLKLDRNQMKLLETLLFLVKLLVFAVPLYIIMSLQGILQPLQESVAQNVVFILQSFGFEVSRNGFLITTNGISFFVSEDCTGWKSMLFLAALIFVVPRVPLKRMIVGIAIGIPVIYIGNLFRILLVILAWHNYGFEFASILHDYLWQAGLIALVLVLWIAWLKWAGKIRLTLIKRRRKLIKPRERKKKIKVGK